MSGLYVTVRQTDRQVNQWQVFEAHDKRGNPCLILSVSSDSGWKQIWLKKINEMIPNNVCYTHRLKPSPNVIGRVSSSNWWALIWGSVAKQKAEPAGPHRRGIGNIVIARVVMDITRT